LDLRHYLDDELDMHHSSASLSVRARVMRQMGNTDSHAIWMTRKPHTPVIEALNAIDTWLVHRKENPESGRPPELADACFDEGGQQIAAGPDVWDGPWNGRPEGACLSRYPAFGTSRTVAGGPVSGDVFKCHLQSVEAALSGGVYGEVDMAPWRSRLAEVFPGGVCDYAQGDAGRPADLP
ncbi:MAG: DUF6351 family protein, partial [Pseudomonadota bacterium]